MAVNKPVPNIHNREELKKYIEPMYIIENHMNSYDEYNEFLDEIYAVINGCFEICACREFPIKFKFRSTDPETYTLQFRHFIINTFLWYAFVELKGLGVLNADFIMDCEKDIAHVNDYINDKIIETLRHHQIKSTTINRCISEVLYRLRGISEDFSILMNVNFSLKAIYDFADRHPRVKEIMNSTYEPGMQPADIEAESDKKLSELMNIMIADKDFGIGTILAAGTGIKPKQLGEFFMEQGYISDIDGNTIPINVTNSILQGSNKPSELYISCSGARKPLLMNKSKMGDAGYFAKELAMAARTIKLSRKVSDCGTHHLVPYKIASKAALDRVDGKYYKLDPHSMDLFCVDSRKDTQLIGKTIYCRSVATCALHGDEICHKCWGRNSTFNFDIPDGIANHDGEQIGQTVQQDILSTKHLLTTNSEKVEFDGPFDSYFTISCGQISPSSESSTENMDDYAIYIDPNDVAKLDELDADSRFNTCIINGRFYVVDMVDKNKEALEIKTTDKKELYITDEILAIMRKNKGYIPLKELGDEFTIFEINITNNELTKPLNDIMKLFKNNKSGEVGGYSSIEEISQRALDLLVEAKINASITAMESLINRMITKHDNVERPDFSKRDMPDYEIISIIKYLENGPYPLLGMSFQFLKRQWLSEELFTTRESPSYVDPLFTKEISTKHMKEYLEMMGDEPVSKFLDY